MYVERQLVRKATERAPVQIILNRGSVHVESHLLFCKGLFCRFFHFHDKSFF